MNFFKKHLRGIWYGSLIFVSMLGVGALQSGLTWSYFIFSILLSIFLGYVADSNKSKGTNK